MLSSTLFGDMFGTAAMRAAFGELAFLARCAEVEAALARAQARLGIVPDEAAAAISAAAAAVAANPETLDLARLQARDRRRSAIPILPLVRQLAERAGAAGRWLHWGATTQDIMDTAAVLQIRDGLAPDRGRSDDAARPSRRARPALSRHADGRAHPSAAGPADHLRLQGGGVAVAVRPPCRAPRRSEAAGAGRSSSAAPSARSPRSARARRRSRSRTELARELGLGEPAITWHVARDAIAETVQFLALLGGSLGKIAVDVMLMSATEFGEAAEPFVAGRGSSSTMPQKRNPISCELILAAAQALRQHAGLALDAMVSDFERTTAAWHLEWIARAGELRLCRRRAASGRIHARRADRRSRLAWRQNLGMTHGLIVAEAVMMGLAPHTGRTEAHDLVYDACRLAIESDRPLYDVLLETPAVAGPLGAERLRALTDPGELSRRRPGDGRSRARRARLTEIVSPHNRSRAALRILAMSPVAGIAGIVARPRLRAAGRPADRGRLHLQRHPAHRVAHREPRAQPRK